MRFRVIFLLFLLVYCQSTVRSYKAPTPDTTFTECYSKETLDRILSDSTIRVLSVDTTTHAYDSVENYWGDMWLSETTYTVKHVRKRP